MTSREVMQQALEALETLMLERGSIYETAITALREALEQPEQKPMHPEFRKMWEDYFDKCFRTQPEQEPSAWRDMIVATLVREGINKHRARELADHFAAQPEPVAMDWQQGSVPLGGNGCSIVSQKTIPFEFRQPAAQLEQEPVAFYHPRNGFYWAKPTSIFAPTVVDVQPMPLYTSPAQREWQSLTDEDWEKVANRKNTVLDTFEQGATWAAYKLERRNT